MPRESLTREQIRRAAEDLKAQGVVPSRENIAEQAAMSQRGKDEKKDERASDELVVGPGSEIARRKQREADEARRKGPPAELLRRFREKHGR